MGAMVLDSLFAPTNQTEQKPNHCISTTTTTEEGSTLSDLCGLFKPCGKRI